MAGKTDERIDLTARHCVPCEGGTPPLGEAESGRLLAGLEGWERVDNAIGKLFRFKGYGQTMAFVNAVAWVAMRENHHPDLQVGYNTCRVTYTTHAVGGLSENDFICAAKVEALLA
jgi:4a-hydroxytetrahydrobiopterin dehydratase